MTNFSMNSSSVRVDFYKPSGKWYMTEAFDMNDQYETTDIHRAVRAAIIASFPEHGERWLSQFIAVVLEPYHLYAHPVMLQPERE
jgi:hypothetical protein